VTVLRRVRAGEYEGRCDEEVGVGVVAREEKADERAA